VINRTNSRRIAIALALGGALLVSYPAVSGGLFWDLGAACGYVCLILLVCLYVFPVRGDGLPHARLLGLSQHKTIGWCVLGAGAAHVVVVLVAEPLSTRYLLPSAPLFMWCGVVATVAVVASVITGLSARSHMRGTSVPPRPTASSPQASAPSPQAAASSPEAATCIRHSAIAPSRGAPWATGAMHSRATIHIVLATIFMLTACGHVIGSSQVLSGVFKPTVVLLLLSLPLGWYALRPRPTRRHAPGANAHALARPTSHIIAVAIIALMPAPMAKQFLLEPVARPAAIQINFPHDLHTSVNCVVCHHNYVDHTGTTACVECHRSSRTDLVHSSEATFHTFCRDCHTQLALDSHKHGPTRSCAACHQGIRSNNL
jgi:hypothetical protein